jgi:hypothetical protein
LRLYAQSLLQCLGVVIMMTATIAFTLQGTFIAASQTVTGENSHYHHGYAHSHAFYEGHAKSHVVAHVHNDGTVHEHVVDDDDGALNDHVQEPGCPCCWNMAIVIGVLPSATTCTVLATLGGKLAIDMPTASRGIEPNGPRRPPRPPSIA